MTAPTPVEVFDRALKALEAGDLASWPQLCTDDVVFEFPFAPPGMPRRVEGRAAVGEYLAGAPAEVDFEAVTDVRTHQTTDPDVAVVEMSARGTVKATGAPYEMSYVVVVTVRDGLIAHYRDYWNPLTAAALA